MFSKNINILLITIIIIIYTFYYNNTIILPHSKNEDDFKYINTEENIIGVALGEHKHLFDINKKPQKDFHTSSSSADFINSDKFFSNNIKINDIYNCLNDNCLNDNYIINTKQVDILNNKYNINIYNNDKIINGKGFLIGNNLIKGYEK